MNRPGNPVAPRTACVLIIGSGFAGIGMAIKLRERGIRDIVILERAADLGGTWRDNQYPGCACDVESTLYSFSFAPNPAWTRTFSPQGEIHAYLRQVANAYGIGSLIRFGEEVKGARWDEQAQAWAVASTTGIWRAQHLVMANGLDRNFNRGRSSVRRDRRPRKRRRAGGGVPSTLWARLAWRPVCG